jgi:hypothetical protein
MCHPRTVLQQCCVLRNLSSGISIYSSPLISAERCAEGQEIDSQWDTYICTVPAGFSAPSQTSIQLDRVSKQKKLFYDWGRRIKSNFFFSDDKLTVSKYCW